MRFRNIPLISKTGSDMIGKTMLPGFITTLLILLTLFTSIHSTVIPLTADEIYPSSNLSTREINLQPCRKRVERVGDGNPHSSCKYHQVTGNLICNGQDCQAGHAEGREFSWSLGGSGGGSFSSLGFGVSASYTSENTYSCGNTPAGASKVCIFALVSFTEYTAREAILGGECIRVHNQPYIIRAPNLGHRQNFKCEHDAACIELDHEVWEHNGQGCPT